MELMAAISALEALKGPSRVELHTDSEYVQNGISEWIHGWKRTAGRPPTRSRSRTSSCGSASMRRGSATRCTGTGCKGHAGHVENERADELAREGMAPFLRNGS